MPPVTLPTSPSRSSTVGTAGGNPPKLPSPSTRTAPPKTSRDLAPDMPEGRAATPLPAATSMPRQRTAAAALQVVLLGRELDWKDQARMRSGAAVESLQSGLERQARHTGALIESIVVPVANYFERAGETQAALAVAAAAGCGAAAFVAAQTEPAQALAQQWQTGAAMLSPVLVPAVALAVGAAGAATAEYFAPTRPLRDLERIAQGPHAQQLADAMQRMHDALPEASREAMRPALLEALPALERMAEGPHAQQMLGLARELVGTAAAHATHRHLWPTLHHVFEALAGPHAPAVSRFIRTLCPPSAAGMRAEDAGTLAALANIAGGPHAAAVFDFMSDQLAAFPEGAARAGAQRSLTAALSTLAGLAHLDRHATARVLDTFEGMVRDHGDGSQRAELRQALLEKFAPFAQLFSLPDVDARFTSQVAFQGARIPFGGPASPAMQGVAAAASRLSASKPANPLNKLLGLSEPAQSLAFWLSKAGGS